MRGIIVVPWILAALAAAACSRQEAGWEAARRENTIPAFQEYLDRFPAGAHRAQARKALLALRESEAWARTDRLGTPEALQRYLGEWPDGAHAADARLRLQAFIPPPAPAARPRAAPGFEIQLGAFSEEAAARTGLESLQRLRAAELGGMQARIAPPGAGEPRLWRLRAGPLEEAAARALCAKLAAEGTPCVTVPAGSSSKPP
jgi:hypothetical protein